MKKLLNMTKHYVQIRSQIFLLVLLLGSALQVKAEVGFWGEGAASIGFNYCGNQDNWEGVNATGEAERSLGNISKLYLKGWWFKTWRNTDDLNWEGELHYMVYPAGQRPQPEAWVTLYKNYDENLTYNNDWPTNVLFGGRNLDINLVDGLAEGEYVLEYFYKGSFKNSTNEYLSNGSKNYKINFHYYTGMTSCFYSNATTAMGGSQIALSWQTTVNGDVVINLLDYGKITGATFRSGGIENINALTVLSGDGFATSEPASTYFTKSNTDKEVRLTKKADVVLPSPCKIRFKSGGGQALAWKDNGDKWNTETQYEYLYGTHCQSVSAPTDVVVTTAGRVSFTEVPGADSYVAHIYDGAELVSSQEITNGGLLQFITTKTSYSVKVIAAVGEFGSGESEAATWNTYAYHVFGTSDLNNYTYSGFENGGSKVALTANTNSTGDVVITISNVSGDAPVLFRDGALTASKFKVYFGEDFAEYALATAYFDISKNDAKTSVVLSRKENAQLPYPCIIKFDAEGDGALEWTANGVGKWTRPKFQYTYGTTCRVNEGMPGNVSVSTMGRVRHDNVAGAEKYAAVVMKDGKIVLQQDITSGAPLNWIPTVSGTYQVTVIAFDAEGNMFDVPAEEDWTVEAGHMYGRTNIYVKDYGSATNSNGANNEPAYFTWETLANGNVVISMTDAEGNLNANYHFRGTNAFKAANFALNGDKDAFTAAFSCTGNKNDGQTFVLTLNGDAPAVGSVISYSGNNVEYSVPGATGAWPTDLSFSYAYGTGRYPKEATAPVIASFTGESNDYTTATLTVAASDKDDDNLEQTVLTYSLEGDNGFGVKEVTPAAGVIELTDLKKNTIYNFTLTVSDPSGNSAQESVEVKMKWDASENLALNKPSLANAEQGDNVKASKANNGNPSDFWTSYDAAKPEGDDYYYWQVDLEELYAISIVKIIFNDHDGTYNVLSSTDGTEWHTYKGNITDVTNVHQNEETPYIIENAVTARYFRFTSTSSRVGIKEFRVYGTGYAGADSQKPVISKFSGVSNAATEVTFHVEASDVDDNGAPQPLTYSLAGNNDFAAQAIVLDGEGNFTISGLKKNRDYEFTLTAIDPSSNQTVSDPITVRMQFDAEDNLALNKPAECGCSQGESRGADKANDGSTSTSWGTYGCADKATANIWIVDLGAIFDVDRIHIICDGTEGATPETTIYASWDNTNWVAITAAQPMGSSGEYTLNSLNAPARYLKLQSAGTGMQAVKEFEVYGLGYATTDHINPQVAVSEVEAQKQTNSVVLHIVATDEDDAHVVHLVKSIAISSDDHGFATIENAELDGEGNIKLTGLKDNATYNFHVLVTDRVGLTAEQDIEVRVAFNTETNLALAKNGATAEAGDAEAGHEAGKAIDGSATSYWGTYKQSGRDNWEEVNTLTITLADSYNIRKIAIKTGGFDANKHDATLEYSADGSDWTEFKAFAPFEANHEYDLPVIITAQYIRFKATKNGMISIQEFEVYGSGYDDPDTEKPVIESAALVGEAGEDNATIAVTATDNVGVYACRFEDGEFSQTVDLVAGQCHVTGLVPGTTYTFSIIALDRAGNESEPFEMESFRTVGNDAVPHTAAPTPKQNAIDVLSIYSDHYEAAVKPGFGWNVFNGAGNTGATHSNIAGDNYTIYKLGAGTEVGIGSWNSESLQLNGTDGHTYGENKGLNIAGYKFLHVDVWTTESWNLTVTLNDQTLKANIQLYEGWNSIDLPISDFITAQEAIAQNLRWMKFTNAANHVLAVDNIYFWIDYKVEIDENSDNSSKLSVYDNRYVNVTLKRAFAAGVLHTLCLPFSMDEAQVEETFGAGTEVWYLTGSEDRGSLIHIDFEQQGYIEAGVPYLFKPAANFVSGTSINGVVIVNTPGASVRTDLFTMKGYVNPTNFDVADGYYFLTADQYLHTLGNNLTSPGLRSAFSITEGADPAAARKPARVVLGTDITTDIPAINTEVGLEKIMRDGHLYIIRDGKMYNVQGQLVK